MDRVVIGTRGSQLARWQANWAKSTLEELYPGLQVELRIISTKGDRVTDISLPKLGEQGKGLFTLELEEEMIAGKIDIAVHSLKDLPTEVGPGLHIGAICRREEVRDAFVARAGVGKFSSLSTAARIGTSSLRRQSQILAVRPDLILGPVRGNVDTRLKKLDAGQYDAIILAAAGLNRLGWADRITELLDEEIVLPAVGQGALAIESRSEDDATNHLVSKLNHPETRTACDAERALLRGLGGGCLVPIAALARVNGSRLELKGLVASPDGKHVVADTETGPVSEPLELGTKLADHLLQKGAARLLAL